MYEETVSADMFVEEKELPGGFWEDLPKPLFWRLLVLPVKPKAVSKGGIVLALANQEAQDILNYIGKVVAVGPQAGAHERLGGAAGVPAAGFPSVGDYVIFGRYSGQVMRYRGFKILCLNDDELLATVPNPDLLQTAV